MSDLLKSEVDLEAVLAAADEEEAAVRPDEPSLPPGEWMRKNLFSSPFNTVLTIVFALGALWAYRAILNFIFSENTQWDSVRINLRLMFTQAYPDENYTRVWVTMGIVMALGGLSLGLAKSRYSRNHTMSWGLLGIGLVSAILAISSNGWIRGTIAIALLLVAVLGGIQKTTGGLSLKKIATWCFGWGGLIVLGVLLREPSVKTDGSGEAVFTDANGVELVRDDLGSLTYANGDPAPSQGLELVRESFGAAMGARTGWWLIGLLLLALGAAIWFGFGDFRRRNTFVPATPFGIAGLGVLISSVWWYRWGNYTFSEEGFTYEPGEKVASSTSGPWTVMFFVLVAAYFVGRRIQETEQAGAVRAITNLSWLLAPFVTFWAVLRGPVLDWDSGGSFGWALWIAIIVVGAGLLFVAAGAGLGVNGQYGAAALAAVGALVYGLSTMGWWIDSNFLHNLGAAALLLGAAGLLVPKVEKSNAAVLGLIVGWIGATSLVVLLDGGYVARVDIPLYLLFAVAGGLILWALTRPGIGETGRIIAVGLLVFAAYNWIVAFFGYEGIDDWDETWTVLEPVRWLWNLIFVPIIDFFVSGHLLDRISDDIRLTHMLQKVRLSFLFLGLAALLAPNFQGDAKQRMKLIYGWLGFITIFHVLVTLINTPSSIEVPTEDFAGGFMVSIYVSIFTMLFSFPLGVLLALARTSRLPIFRVMSTVYIESFRGVPLITMLFFFTVFVNLFLPEGMELSLFAAVVVAFVLFSAAYLAENVRGGLQAIRRGQYEASDALGLTTVQRTAFIVLPQGLRVSIPPLVGQVIATFKETSLLAIVGVFDFLRMARDVIPAQTEFLGVRKPGLLFICVIYFIGAYAMSKYSQRLEKQLGVGER